MLRVDCSRSSLTARLCRSLMLSGLTVSKSVPQYRHRSAIALIVSPQAGHFLVSPQADSGVSAGAAFSPFGAFSQPYVAQPADVRPALAVMHLLAERADHHRLGRRRRPSGRSGRSRPGPAARPGPSSRSARPRCPRRAPSARPCSAGSGPRGRRATRAAGPGRRTDTRRRLAWTCNPPLLQVSVPAYPESDRSGTIRGPKTRRTGDLPSISRPVGGSRTIIHPFCPSRERSSSFPA